MNAKQKEALKASIAHWRRLAKGSEQTDEGPFSEHCALCVEFYENDECAGCPVARLTGKSECDDTPYWQARRAWEDWKDSGGLVSEEAFREAAEVQLNFLRALLPERDR